MLQYLSQIKNMSVFMDTGQGHPALTGPSEDELGLFQKEMKLCHITQEHHLHLVFVIKQCSTIRASDGWQQFCQMNTAHLSQKDSVFSIVLMLEAFSISVY